MAKLCSRCKKPLPNKRFSIDNGRPDGLQRICKECQKVWYKEYKKNPEVSKRTFAGHIKRLFGLTLEQYDTMVKQQKGLCAICGKPEDRKYKGVLARLSVDHCHTTGEIRALLCNRCNRTLGSVWDNTELLEKMIHYLKKYKGE